MLSLYCTVVAAAFESNNVLFALRDHFPIRHSEAPGLLPLRVICEKPRSRAGIVCHFAATALCQLAAELAMAHRPH